MVARFADTMQTRGKGVPNVVRPISVYTGEMDLFGGGPEKVTRENMAKLIDAEVENAARSPSAKSAG